MASGRTYVVEHLDPELGDWSALEYAAIAKESHDAGAQFLLSGVPRELQLPAELERAAGLKVEHKSIEETHAELKDRICLLDPQAKEELGPRDAEMFDVFLFGGILGDDPPRDRTSELRKKGFQGRRLGPVQMTTDTAVRVTRIVIQEQIPLEEIPYVDHPELKINKHESTEMPFRYVKDKQGRPIMPKGMFELIAKDAERGFDDFL